MGQLLLTLLHRLQHWVVQLLHESALHHVRIGRLPQFEKNGGKPGVIDVGWRSCDDFNHKLDRLNRLGYKSLDHGID